MSLTSQLQQRNSSVRQFFSSHEHKQGMEECISLLRSSRPFLQTDFTPPFYVASIIGTASDYLIRYIANGNKLNFKEIIAAEAVKRGELFFEPDDDCSLHLRVLFDIGKFGLRGQAATCPEAVVSSLSLALLDNFYRSGHFPKSFSAELSADERKDARRLQYGQSYPEKKSFFRLFKYLDEIGGDSLVRDTATIAHAFESGLQNPQSEICGMRFVVYNRALHYSYLVGGADFDCVVLHNNCHILTEIKSTKKSINTDHLRQLLGYSLLYSRSRDRFAFTHLGVYYSRACSFRYLPVDFVTAKCLPTFATPAAARTAFRKHMSSTGAVLWL
jgi:hypothetical protein